MEVRRTERGLGQRGQAQVGQFQIGWRKPGAVEVRLFQIGVLQARSAEICATEIGLPEVGVVYSGPPHVRPTKVPASQRRTAQDGLAEVCILQIGAGKVCPPQVGALKRGFSPFSAFRFQPVGVGRGQCPAVARGRADGEGGTDWPDAKLSYLAFRST